MIREAKALQQRARDGGDGESCKGFFTTLLVFSNQAYAGQGPVERNCGAFPVCVCECACVGMRACTSMGASSCFVDACTLLPGSR